MCGIAGIIHFTNQRIDAQHTALLVDSLKHRGPDGDGVWYNESQRVAMCHTRLSVLDLSSSGKQPMLSSDGRYVIVLNGEIYNFIEIREELKLKNYNFHSETDTEVLLAAYHEWGEKMLDRFNGMWSFAIYDSINDTVFLSRDRFGVKPLYYYRDTDRMIFASEVQAIHKVLGNKHPQDDEVIKDIVHGGFLSHGTERTYLKDVFSLPGGYNLIVQNKLCKKQQWYALKKIRVPEKFKQQVAELRGLLSDACKLRLRSDVAIGTCLSGGVDSGSITALVNHFNFKEENRFNNYTHRGFCASFPNSSIDEKDQAALLADKLGSRLDIVDVNPPTSDELKEAMGECDGPMHSLAFFPIWSLYRYIKSQGITVTLDGQGPDEMLGGYRPIKEALHAAIELRKPFWFWDIYKTYSAQGETKHFSSKKYAKKVLSWVKGEQIQRIKSFLTKYFLKRKADFYLPLVSAEHLLSPVRKADVQMNAFDIELYNEFFVAPLPGILQQYDRCSMSHGVECRMPFMDYRVVEFIFSLPVESKVGGGYTKRILREAMQGLMPDEIRLNKLKIGFNAPIVEWFKAPLKEFMLEVMNSEEFLNSNYFDGEAIRNNYLNFLKIENPDWNMAWQFWPPVHLAWWLKNIVK